MTVRCVKVLPSRNPLTRFWRSFANVPDFVALALWATWPACRRRASHRKAATGLPMQTLQALLAKKLSDGLARAGLPAAGELTQATDPRFGDYQTNVALVLGKQRGENR